MPVFLSTVIGIMAAVMVLFTRRGQTVGFYRHILVGAVVATAVALAYSLITKTGLDVLDAGRLLLTFVSAIIAVYLSILLALTAENSRPR